MTEVEIKGYVDPRTGEYKYATEANRDEVREDMGFLFAWKFYWDGPLDAESREPVYKRMQWIPSDRRTEWLMSLSQEQRDMLLDSHPPEEVPGLVHDG